VEAIVRATQKQKPSGQTHWSRRTLAASNKNPKPFTWSATPESILAKISKVKAIYETLR
jgi:hypothetical protein